MAEVIFVRSKKKPGFRRAGLFFPFEGVNVDTADLNGKQFEQIKAEPRLIIEEGKQVQEDDTPSELIEDIVEAIGILDPDKKPNVKDLENVIGKDITAADRDKAWDVYRERVGDE